MDRERWKKIKELFEHALDLAPESRAEYLARACGKDSALRTQVVDLLEHDRRAGSFLESSPARAGEESGPDEDRSFTFASGEVLAGRFQITRFIGHGGMGEVYEAHDLEFGSHVALKTLRPKIARDGWALKRFRQEFQLARRVTHPNVCRIFDMERHRMEEGTAGPGFDVLFIAMELLKGEGLSERLRREGRMSVDEALPLIQQMGGALQAAHDAGVIHRDFKPGNVMLVPVKSQDNVVRAVVTDFGLARAVVSAAANGASFAQTLSKTEQLLGTLAYMAPEQLEGGEVTPATDVYALGLVAYEMLAGRPPFPEDAPLGGAFLRVKGPPPSPRVYVPKLDRGCEAAILRCLEIDPAHRFPSAQEAAVVFARTGQPGPQAMVSRVKAQFVNRKPASRLRVPLAAISSAAVLLVMIAFHARTRAVAGNSGLTRAFSLVPTRMITARENHTATLLKNGMVLIAGGDGLAGILASAEIYNPSARTFTATGKMTAARFRHTATLLPNGQVLIAGGEDSSGAALVSAELYDPATGRFSPTGRLNTARESHTATLLNNGLVLIASGCVAHCSARTEINSVSAEVYNPATGTFAATGSLHDAREFHKATLLNNGRVLIAGGLSSMNVLASAELYDPTTGAFTYTGSMNTARYNYTATLLPKGIVLIAGGRFVGMGYTTATAELYDPAAGTFAVTGTMQAERAYDTATLLESGLVLLAGGEGSNPYLNSAELYNPATGAVATTGSMKTSRAGHTATRLMDGKVLLAGGYNGAAIGTAELY